MGARPDFLVLAALAALAACRQDMHDQPKGETFEASAFFDDGRVARPLIEGTVARGRLELDEHLERGLVDGKPAATFPFEIERADLERGRERYGIFCSPCHDAAGTGNGMVVQRGMKRPPSFHEQRLRDAQPGYFFDVITNGFGVMFDYRDRIDARDRWRIIAYVRALQLAQDAELDDVPPQERAALEAR
jgi:hypothetical protein